MWEAGAVAGLFSVPLRGECLGRPSRAAQPPSQAGLTQGPGGANTGWCVCQAAGGWLFRLSGAQLGFGEKWRIRSVLGQALTAWPNPGLPAGPTTKLESLRHERKLSSHPVVGSPPDTFT